MRKRVFIFFSIAIVLLLFYQRYKNGSFESLGENLVQKPKVEGFQMLRTSAWLKKNGSNKKMLAIALAINRTDSIHLVKMDSIIVPLDFSGDPECYQPFPVNLSFLGEVKKNIFFSYPTQSFACYEKGILVRSGPTNMGRKEDLTPTGLFFTNWKAKETISTFNDEWILRWNFNIVNDEGIGWHQYSLPGFPASHSCLRLLEEDARFLYFWADQWILKDKLTILVKGTPVVIFGKYDFNAPKPWLELLQNPHALDISETELEKITHPFLDLIRWQQSQRELNAR